MIAVKAFKKHSESLEIMSNKQEEIGLQLRKELFNSVRSFLIISEIFVSAPIGVHLENSSGLWCERILQLLHYIWCIIIYTILATSVWSEAVDTNFDLATTEKPLYSSEYLVYLVHVLQILVASYYARSKFEKFLCTIVNIDQEMLGLSGIYPEYNLNRKFLNRHLQLILAHFVSTSIIGYFYCEGVFLRILSNTTVYMLPNVILHISLAQYYGLLYAIAIRWRGLNRVLRLELSKVNGSPLILRDKLQKIRLLFSELELFTNDVNDAFGQSVVLVYVGSYMNISLNIFLIYKHMENASSSDWPWSMYSVVWTCMHIGKMFLILYYNHYVQMQKKTTALLLNDIKAQNLEIEEMITHFIFQMIIDTRSNVVCGVAVLNLDFIKSLLVAVSTLFIFLLQYDTTFEALALTRKSGVPTSNS